MASKCAILGVAAILVIVGAVEATVTKQEIAIPAYSWNETLWKQIEQGSEVGIAVVNPNSGPSTEKVQLFADAIRNCVNAGRKVIGYVDTGYFGLQGNRKTKNGQGTPEEWTKQVKEEIETYYRFYGDSGLSGIFLDDGLNECGENNMQVNLYANIQEFIRTKFPGALIVLNPGTGTEECYAAVADIIIVFESPLDSYLKWVQPDWSQNYENSKKFWHLVLGVKTTEEMVRCLDLSRKRNAGYVYFTDDDLPNPWDTLPTYWQDELAQVKKANTRACERVKGGCRNTRASGDSNEDEDRPVKDKGHQAKSSGNKMFGIAIFWFFASLVANKFFW